MYESNEILEKLPRHLLELVIDQPYNSYTEQDHAIWRFVMRQNVRYLSLVAHGSYLQGLKKTGISIDRIPHMYGMNRILREIGWAAVAVDGFIPPSAFMEFQAYNVLVIAADIRPINQIEYTPAPDIIHEAAGHAPIIADEEYAEYLSFFGQIGSKALSSANDFKLYEAIRHLSILKADPYTPFEDIEIAENELLRIERNMGNPSEMALIRNLHWWTVEYGLIGDLKNPEIYGAGLLSSIGESYSCLKPEVKKLPYTIDAKNIGFDITTRQPQLFVTPDFATLSKVLNEFANQMALRRGGLNGIQKAINSENTATAVFSSGLQVSGRFSEVISDDNQIVYIKTSGPTILCHGNKVITGHGKDYHLKGFGSPVGKIRNCATPPELLTDGELAMLKIQKESEVSLEFDSGVIVQGVFHNLLRKNGKIQIMSFSDCTVTYHGQILFMPSWGIFDMAVGESVVSVFAGPADPVAFDLTYSVPAEKTHKIEHTEETKRLHMLFGKVRQIRETGIVEVPDLEKIWETLKNKYQDDWLLAMEILEILTKNNLEGELKKEIESELLKRREDPSIINLIDNGFAMLGDVSV